MKRFLVRRAFTAVITLLAVTVLVFVLARMTGDPRVLLLGDQTQTSQEQWDAWGRDFGIDKPIAIQYVIYLGKLVRGDLGDSILQRRPVAELIWHRLPNSAQLAGVAFAFSIVIGIPLGIVAAVTRGSAWDYSSRSFAMFGHAAPSFWVGIVLIFVFAVGVNVNLGLFEFKTDWFPTSRKEAGLLSYVLPGLTLGWASAGGQLRLMRSSMLEVLDAEYIKLARAKGASRTTVILKHAVRNAFIAPLTYAGLTLAGLVTGTIVVETVFAWPGLGLLSIWAVNNSDYPILQGIILLVTFAFVLTAFITDVLYAFLDPRIRFT
ncbi:MAG: ABC transporter permease [Chloroflexi bacterium]|nr:ABC transporter permease [Chloroflexota bacterium]